MHCLFRFAVVGVLCAFLSACSSGPKMVKITGTLKSKDESLKIDKNGSVTVIFVPVVEPGKHYTTYTGIYRAEDPTFVINEIPEGKYKVALMCMVPQPTRETEDINQRFTDKDTPILREVKGGGEPIVIDITKPN